MIKLTYKSRGQPEIGIVGVRTKQVACDVLPLRTYALTHFH